jgi:UDP-apiose/xylose synthase
MAASDMVEAVCRIVERPSRANGQIFNLGNPENDLSIAELGHKLAEVFAAQVAGAAPARFERVTAEQFYGPGYADTDERIPDIKKARRLLAWRPTRTMGEMLPDIVADYLARYADRIACSASEPPRRRASLA